MEDSWFNYYKFLKPIGSGGMGIVYLAYAVKLNKEVVVKQLASKSDDVYEISEAIRLFEREAKLLRTLSHSGIVPILDYHVTVDGKYFLVMDYIKGKDLSVVLKNFGTFDSEATVEIGIQCCKVLDYMHSQNPPIIYRDLKPSNLMLTPEGKVIFIDFGIARIVNTVDKATKVVTSGYSPPEQYYGRPEPRSDLYALGITMGHLLTGVKPKPLTQSNPIKDNSKVNGQLNDLIFRLTSYNIEDRPKSANEVLSELKVIFQTLKGYPRTTQTSLPGFSTPSRATDTTLLQKIINFIKNIKNDT